MVVETGQGWKCTDVDSLDVVLPKVPTILMSGSTWDMFAICIHSGIDFTST